MTDSSQADSATTDSVTTDSATTDAEQAHEDVVRAAGGMVVRRSLEGEIEVAIVHRPLREDWTFPKGKLEPGESLEECALREVYEETGFACKLSEYVGTTEYPDRKARSKVVTYWTMHVEDGNFSPGAEVDALRWVDLAGAKRLLTYERDLALLGAVDSAAQASLGPRGRTRTDGQ